LGDLNDINKSVLTIEDAVQLTPDGHPDKPGRLNNLGNCMLNNGSASIRFEAARRWANMPKFTNPHLYSVHILLPLNFCLNWHGWGSLTAGQVVRDAASAAIAEHDYQKAVEWLDQGRSVIWGQLLNLRTPRSHAHALRRNGVLQQIRELSGFERFLLSKPISELSQAAKMGPVAILNISAYGCDALILMPGLADEVSMHWSKSLASIVGTPGRNDRLHGSIEGAMAPDDIFSHILSEIWFKIVRPVLNVLQLREPRFGTYMVVSNRATSIPSYPCSRTLQQGSSLWLEIIRLPDFVLYTIVDCLNPRVSHNLNPRPDFNPCCHSTVSGGQSYIPGTHEEIKAIEHHAKGKVPVLWLDRHMATIEEVQKGMKESRWVHFACHGVQSTSPTESALLLAGNSRSLSPMLTWHSSLHVKPPLVPNSSKMSRFISRWMLLAGYRGVIGTMWSIMDHDAPQVAGDVYAHLLEASPPDPTRAAAALISPFGSFKSSSEQDHFALGAFHTFWGLNWGYKTV
ncbi:hypothetical protein B0H13DRAFT_1927933, partial [Mycena leptocephala]